LKHLTPTKLKRFSHLLVKKTGRVMPGLPELLRYSRRPLRADLAAGLAVASIALPTSIAYAQLAGFSPEIGLYSTILPMLIYAFFGTSRQLIVGPDAATCAMITATLTPLAMMDGTIDRAYYHALAVSLTVFTGIFCLLAGRFRFGFLSDLLSRSILLGLMNGVGVTIIIGQLCKLIGTNTPGNSNITNFVAFLEGIPKTHIPTLLLSLFLFLIFFLLKRRFPKAPVALTLAVLGVLYGSFATLPELAVTVVGEIPPSLPTLHLPAFPHQSWGTILPAAAALAFISFSSAMLTAKSFAAKNGYEIDSNKELSALGIANIASALSQGFTISGADSRTAVSDAAGGKTRMVQVFAALAILLALLLLTKPIANLPVAVLGVILIISAAHLLDLRTMFHLHSISKYEFYITFSTFVVVTLVGVMQGILLAVILALLRFLMQTARPKEHLLGYKEETGEFLERDEFDEAKSVDGLLFYRFDSSLIFINAGYFRQRVRELIKKSKPPIRWVIVDGRSMNNIDLTGALMLAELSQSLHRHGITLALTARTSQFTRWLKLRKLQKEHNYVRLFRDRHSAFAAFKESIAQQTLTQHSTVMHHTVTHGTAKKHTKTTTQK
jgi:high affinity sulfate transporter 1